MKDTNDRFRYQEEITIGDENIIWENNAYFGIRIFIHYDICTMLMCTCMPVYTNQRQKNMFFKYKYIYRNMFTEII